MNTELEQERRVSHNLSKMCVSLESKIVEMEAQIAALKAQLAEERKGEYKRGLAAMHNAVMAELNRLAHKGDAQIGVRLLNLRELVK